MVSAYTQICRRWLILCCVTVGSFGCLGDEIVDSISTELTITTPGSPGTEVEIRKRFRFSRDPSSARGVYFDQARLQILSPVDSDLAALDRIEVYALIGELEERVLIAYGDGYVPGDRVVPLTVVHLGDLRPFVGDDSRILFAFVARGSTWYRPWPEGGFTVLAAASIAIDI